MRSKLFIYPIRKKDKILHLRNKFNVYFLNDYGFFTNESRVLENVHSTHISKLSVIDVISMEDISSTNIAFLSNNVKLEYKDNWFNLDSNKILKVHYTNSTVKYFRLTDNYTFEKIDKIYTIVYVNDDSTICSKLQTAICNKYNCNNTQVIFKYFDTILPALVYILSNYVDVVITKEFMKDLSAKNLIKRIRKSKSRIKFIILSNNSNIQIDNVKFCDDSKPDLLFKKLDSCICSKKK